MITYETGDATRPDIEGRVVIAHVLSDTGAYGAGFAKAVAQRYPRAATNFASWYRGDHNVYRRRFGLGAIQWVGVGHSPDRAFSWSDRWIVNMVAQHGLRSPRNPHPLDLAALRTCLVSLAKENADDPIVMPRIGCGLAGGTWDEVGPIVEEILVDHEVYVYDLPGPEAGVPALVDRS